MELLHCGGMQIGLSGAIVKTYLPKCGSYMELTLRALRHSKCISSYVPDRRVEELGSSLGWDYHHFFVQLDIMLATCEDLASSTTTVKRMYNDGSLVTLHTFNRSRNVLIKIGPFAPISNHNFVFWGNNNIGWIGWKLN